MNIRWEYAVEVGVKLGLSAIMVVFFFWIAKALMQPTPIADDCKEARIVVRAFEACRADPGCELDSYDYKKHAREKFFLETTPECGYDESTEF